MIAVGRRPDYKMTELIDKHVYLSSRFAYGAPNSVHCFYLLLFFLFSCLVFEWSRKAARRAPAHSSYAGAGWARLLTYINLHLRRWWARIKKKRWGKYWWGWLNKMCLGWNVSILAFGCSCYDDGQHVNGAEATMLKFYSASRNSVCKSVSGQSMKTFFALNICQNKMYFIDCFIIELLFRNGHNFVWDSMQGWWIYLGKRIFIWIYRIFIYFFQDLPMENNFSYLFIFYNRKQTSLVRVRCELISSKYFVI